MTTVPGQPFHGFSGYLRTPGQVPGRNPNATTTARIDPEIEAMLTRPPGPYNTDRTFDRPVLRARDAVEGLGLSKALESNLSFLIQREAQKATNQLTFQKALYQSMQQSGLPPDLQLIVNQRAKQFYVTRLQKSGVAETFQISELAALRKAAKAPPAKPSMTAKVDPATAAEQAKEETKALKDAEKDAGIEKAETFTIDPEKFQKAHPKGSVVGGQYVARVTQKGKHKYYYDPKRYQADHGLHVSGEQARSDYVAENVHKHVLDAADMGCDIPSMRDLVKKFGPQHVHSAVRRHVDSGSVEFRGGRFYAGKSPKGKK